MFIRDAIEIRHDGSVPNSAFDYHVFALGRGEPVKLKNGDMFDPPEAYVIRWWPSDGDDLDARALEREFELEVDRDGGSTVHWRAGDDDPSGPVTRFVQETLAPQLAQGL